MLTWCQHCDAASLFFMNSLMPLIITYRLIVGLIRAFDSACFLRIMISA